MGGIAFFFWMFEMRLALAFQLGDVAACVVQGPPYLSKNWKCDTARVLLVLRLVSGLKKCGKNH